MQKIAIHFELNNDWIGGSYYIRNLVTAMNMLPSEEQAQLYLISANAESVRFIQESGYPHIGWIKQSQYEAAHESMPFDVLFPHPTDGEEARTVSWVPDFQELHLDYFFSAQEVAQRRGHHLRRFKTAGLIVSSEDVKRDVELFYPGECNQVEVVRFASFSEINDADVSGIRQKYNQTEPYVMCANQVWVHKNHIVLLRAVSILKDRGIRVNIVFTGNENDYRVADYSSFLKAQAGEWGIADHVHFLGFIPRYDQLCLMRGSKYVVQPSLFEGWSTVIEDAKSLSKFVVASDLDVHKEQLSECCRFFLRHDPNSLADAMQDLEGMDHVSERQANYAEARRMFARDFMNAISHFMPEAIRPQTNGMMSDTVLNELSDSNMLEVSVPLETESEVFSTSTTVSTPMKAASLPSSAQEILFSKDISVSINDSHEAYKFLLLFSNGPIELHQRYERLLTKIVFANNKYFCELRSSSIVPDILREATGIENDDGSKTVRITLIKDIASGIFKGTSDAISQEAIDDINLLLRIGLTKLTAKAKTESVARYWIDIREGVQIERTCQTR